MRIVIQQRVNISLSMIDNTNTDRLIHMMTSSNGIIFRVIGPLFGEFTGLQWILCTKASDLRLNTQLNDQSWGWWFETPSRFYVSGKSFV